MVKNSEIQNLRTEKVAEHCNKQTEIFRRAKSSDTRFCYELLRRAAYNISGAWDFVYIQYQTSLANRIRRKLPADFIQKENVEDLVQNALIAFQKYALNIEKWNKFPTLKGALAYMNSCADSAVRDYLRRPSTQLNWTVEPIDINELERELTGMNPSINEHDDFGSDIRLEIHQIVENLMQDEKDKIIFRHMFEYGQKPQEIARQHPTLFEDAGKVSSCKRNLLKRMERDPKMQMIWKNFQGGVYAS